MGKNTFTTSGLDKLIEESISEADQFKEELQSINDNEIDLVGLEDEDDYLPDEDKNFLQKGEVIKHTGDGIAYSYVYKKIGDLIDTGNASLQVLQSIDPDMTDPGILTATGTLINSIRGCIAEFTKIHQQWLRFQQQMKLQDRRLENQKKLLEFKEQLRNGTLNKTTEAEQLHQLGSNELIEFLRWKKEKEESEKKKEI